MLTFARNSSLKAWWFHIRAGRRSSQCTERAQWRGFPSYRSAVSPARGGISGQFSMFAAAPNTLEAVFRVPLSALDLSSAVPRWWHHPGLLFSSGMANLKDDTLNSLLYPQWTWSYRSWPTQKLRRTSNYIGADCSFLRTQQESFSSSALLL